MSHRNKPIIEHECTFVINKVKKIPDGRFKSGFREIATIGTSTAYLMQWYPTLDPHTRQTGTGAVLNHMDKRKDGIWQTLAEVQLEVKLTEVERKI